MIPTDFSTPYSDVAVINVWVLLQLSDMHQRPDVRRTESEAWTVSRTANRQVEIQTWCRTDGERGGRHGRWAEQPTGESSQTAAASSDARRRQVSREYWRCEYSAAEAPSHPWVPPQWTTAQQTAGSLRPPGTALSATHNQVTGSTQLGQSWTRSHTSDITEPLHFRESTEQTQFILSTPTIPLTLDEMSSFIHSEKNGPGPKM